MRKIGNFIISDYFNLAGGLNTSVSPFLVQDTQATGGRNFEYVQSGAVTKIRGATALGSADTSLRTLGAGMHVTSANTRTVIRAADRKVQAVDMTTGVCTNLSEDTVAAGTNVLANGTTVPVTMSQFNTTTSNTLWMAGGGLTNLYAAYSSTKVTANGVAVPTGTLGASAAGTGGTIAPGVYWYGVAFKKTSTGALSNVALDVTVTVSANQNVTVDLSGVVNPDSTKYGTIAIYRSNTAGSQGFTIGDKIVEVAAGTASYVDTGAVAFTASNVPRAGNVNLDNSMLPTGGSAISALCVFKRRLVTAIDSTIYLSDLNKPESWPLTNPITIPSGGPITGVAVIGFVTPTSTGVDELLAIFKDNELWVVTGSSYADWALNFIDVVGCPSQSLIVSAIGNLSWISYSGVYIWDGSSKPSYASRPIEDFFDDQDGTIDKSKLSQGWGAHVKSKNQIIWTVSDTLAGDNKLGIKMDLKLTFPQARQTLDARVSDAVLMTDYRNTAYYGGASVRPSTTEVLFAGDAAGHIYTLGTSFSDAGSGIDFQYETKYMEMDTPGLAKRFDKVVVWVQDTSDATLTLDYWTVYASGSDDARSVSAVISKASKESLWDLAAWDGAYWDNTLKGYNPIVFNLSGAEGDCLKLRFRNSDSNAPVTLAGYSVIFSELGSRK